MVYLTRRYRFCAAHRLNNEALTAEQNRRTYGKCNNPHGHGHNYVLEVTVAGPVDQATGMVINLADLDGVVEREVLERFDHQHLNLDMENFRDKVPTTENLCVEIVQLLKNKLTGTESGAQARLERVRLEETNSNSIEYDCADGRREGKVRRELW